MDSTVPNIYVRTTANDELSWKGRAAALLVVAARLNPSPKGVGSHRQLGLQECQFEARTGLPCPTCGMTTSFAHFVRGNIIASFWVQPMGTVLALMATMTFWTALYIALS